MVARTTLFRNGMIIDGTGKPAFRGNVLVEGGQVRAVFRTNGALPSADEVIDVSPYAVAPGFIDMHSHCDWLMPSKEHPALMKRLPEQGVTTIVGGNCGFSAAPITEATAKVIQESSLKTIIDLPLDYAWRSMADLFGYVQGRAPVVNLAELVGHSTVRIASTDTLRGLLKPDELSRSLDALRRSLDEGACGLSFGLGYDPGMYLPLDELEAFSAVAAKAGKPVTVHLKALSIISPTYPVTYLKPHNIRALREMLDIARRTACRLQVSHFIFVGRRSWGTTEPSIRMVEEARREGVDVMVDAFPYTCGNTTINVVLPYWFLALGEEGYRSKLARLRLRAELEVGFRLVGFVYRDFRIMDAAVSGWENLNGLTIPEVAKLWGKSSFDTLLLLSEKSRGETLMLFETYSGEAGYEKPMESVLAHELCLFETDAIIRRKGYPNPAGMGTFPRILGYFTREKKLFGLEEAVSRMTSKSAARFGLKDRGVLEAGKAADIVVFDPQTIADTTPSGAVPPGRPKGIRDVFINGVPVVKEGAYIEGACAGGVIRT